jgi:hypothetical protein
VKTDVQPIYKVVFFRVKLLFTILNILLLILQRAEPLQRNDGYMGGYTRAVSRQRFAKHVLAAINTNATTEKLL